MYNAENDGSRGRLSPEKLRVMRVYFFVYDVDDELGASKGREKHPCFFNASGNF